MTRGRTAVVEARETESAERAALFSARAERFVAGIRQRVVSVERCEMMTGRPAGCHVREMEDGFVGLFTQPDCPVHGYYALRRQEEIRREALREERLLARNAGSAQEAPPPDEHARLGDAMATAILAGGWDRSYRELEDMVRGRFPRWLRGVKWLANRAFQQRQEAAR